MKRKYAAAAGAVVLAVCLAAAFWVMYNRTPAPLMSVMRELTSKSILCSAF